MKRHLDDDGRASVLASLRSLAPQRRLLLAEALQIAELQAARLLALQDVDDVPVPDEVITSLPRVLVEFDRNLPSSVSGCSDWDKFRRSWVISLNPHEPRTRRRLTMLHEYKHIIDHGTAGLVQLQLRTAARMAPEEYLADYFAGCVLMPRRQLKPAWADLEQSVEQLAKHFDVSQRAMQTRLCQVGLLNTIDLPSDAKQSPGRTTYRPRLAEPRDWWACPARTAEVSS